MHPIPTSERPSPAITAPASSPAPAHAGQGVGTIAMTLGLLFVALVNVAVFAAELGHLLVDAATLVGVLIARLA